MTLQYVQISGSFLGADQSPASGTVTFTPNTTVYAPGIPQLSPDEPITAQVVAGVLKSASGGTLALLATDNALSFVGQTGYLAYSVAAVINGVALDTWSFTLPFSRYGAGPVDLYALANTTAGGTGITPPAGDLGGTTSAPTVVSTHLASPMPVSQGGIGTATAPTNDVFAGPASGGAAAPGFRALVPLDIPALPGYAPTGLTGATAASRYAGATASGAPVSGTFAVGDFIIDQTGKLWVCTAPGTPGTWVQQGTVTGVTAADTSVVIGGTSAAPTVRTATLDVIATDHPPAADWSNNGHKITAVANGFATSDVAAFGQTPAGGSTVTPGQGGTGQVTLQLAMDALAAAVTAGQYLRGNGTHVVLAAIQLADLPAGVALLGGATFTGYVAPKVVPLSQSGGNVAVDASLGNVFPLTLTASGWTIRNPSNPVDGEIIRFRLVQDATGGRSVLWDTAYDFGSGSAPSLTATGSKTDVLGFEYNAATSKWMYLSAPFPQGF